MEVFILHILKLNIIAAIVILLVKVLATLFKGRVSARWKYFIWLLITISLCVPMRLPANLALVDFKVLRSSQQNTQNPKITDYAVRPEESQKITETVSSASNDMKNLTEIPEQKRTVRYESDKWLGIVALIFAIPVGIKQAVKKGTVFDNFWTVFSLLGISVPTFFFALVLIFFVGLQIPGMPINGMRDTMLSSFGYSSIFQEIGDIALHSILPVIVLAFSSFASFSRYVRNSMVEVINMDYVRTARSKGLKEKTVIYKHAFKNAQIPLVTLLGLYIPSLFSGAVILESVFIWPGIGKVLIDAINQRDNSLVMACLMFSALLMLLGNLLSDICYTLVDPRIKVDE